MSSAIDYNRKHLAADLITPEAITKLTEIAQRSLGLPVDGKCGPQTLSRLLGPQASPVEERATVSAAGAAVPLSVDAEGWLVGLDVVKAPIDPSWYYKRLKTSSGWPAAIVWHYTATDPGTAAAMARNRQRPLNPDDRMASWHISIETDGRIWQMIPLTGGAWHAGGETAKPIPGVGSANSHATGVELVGHGESFTPAQVAAAARVTRAIVRRCGIPRALAMISHQSLDPTRRRDPGPVWLGKHAPGVLDAAYAP